jgi:ABC-type multidrug transport system fused ATPase/permease subunit
MLNIFVLPRLNQKFQLQVIHSVQYSAHKYLLTIDPRYHVLRSSGAVLAKIDRAARGYEEILDQITFEFLPLAAAIITMFIVLSQYSFSLALGMGAALSAMITAGYYFARYARNVWEKAFIDTDDDFRATAVENLAQVHQVRSMFASDYMSEKLTRKVMANALSERRLWAVYSMTSRILGLIYGLSIFGMLAYFLNNIQLGLIAVPYALGIVLAYIQSTKPLIKITSPFRRYMRGYSAIRDLFDFMPTVGSCDIPVLGASSLHVSKESDINIEVTNMFFDYGKKTLFNGHNFVLHAPLEQKRKLYGIIGPSGGGKTTLLSILGGQLKPLAGTVFVNNVDIYAVPDASRRQLIALQGQIASALHGTVRYNLLFGLPEDAGYDSAYLSRLLERVGLKQALAEHNGLETMLGEGGLNMSGGQRQRLNFAGLYLRAHYYKPFLILIDEPTSSLDEISEAEITRMIEELAEHSVTLVIAHRLKTIEHAVGIIDLSLLSEGKTITPYTPVALLERSAYYAQLMHGAVQLDS